MCGIFAAVNNNSVTHHLLNGLSSLAYRGYDSAGIAVMTDGALNRARCEGKLDNLSEFLSANPLDGAIGIAHTRWATHGLPNETNAHPHMTSRVAVVHNGIVENANQLRHFLEQNGRQFESETDSENIAQLITHYLDQGFNCERALNLALAEIEGSYSIVAMFQDEQNQLYAARKASPLVIGQADDGYYVSSDENALATLAHSFLHLDDNQVVCISQHTLRIKDCSGTELTRQFKPMELNHNAQTKAGYQHYMLKEIHEQADVFERCWHHYYDAENSCFINPQLPIPLSHISRLTIIACGTSYFSGMLAKQWFESVAGVPVDLEIASEYRYRGAPIVGNSAAIFISQSGETADTLAALRHAKSLGQSCIALVNVINSSMAREADLVLPTLAGPEIGVASTKAFTSQLTCLLTLAVTFAKANLRMAITEERELIHAMRSFAEHIDIACQQQQNSQAIAELLAPSNSVLFLGRGPACALAEEGALKLKEISYIHAEAYAAGELKHGPLALVDEHMPVVIIAPPDALFSKTLSNLREVSSRGGKVILISNRSGIDECKDYIRASFCMPDVHPLLQALLYTIPLQLIAYHTALLRGNDVDQPRNLAKSVTVE